MALAAELVKAGEHPEVILEATYGWYWATDVIKECGGNVHLFSTGVYSYRRPLIVTEAPHRRSALRSLSKVADCIGPSRVFMVHHPLGSPWDAVCLTGAQTWVREALI